MWASYAGKRCILAMLRRFRILAEATEDGNETLCVFLEKHIFEGGGWKNQGQYSIMRKQNAGFSIEYGIHSSARKSFDST